MLAGNEDDGAVFTKARANARANPVNKAGVGMSKITRLKVYQRLAPRAEASSIPARSSRMGCTVHHEWQMVMKVMATKNAHGVNATFQPKGSSHCRIQPLPEYSPVRVMPATAVGRAKAVHQRVSQTTPREGVTHQPRPPASRRR